MISISAHGSIYALVRDAGYDLEAEFCGKIDLLVFSIEGCVKIHAGNLKDTIPAPDHPLLRVDLTDRRGAVTGVALQAGQSAELPNIVWPDATPVLQFSHQVQDSWATARSIWPIPPGDSWSGATEAKCACRLTGLKLLKGGVDQPGPRLRLVVADAPAA